MYLPEDYTHETKIPQAYNRDFLMQVRLINERWRRFYPAIEYFCFLGQVTASVDAASPTKQTSIVGEPLVGGEVGSAFDELWGETVDPAMRDLDGGVWSQPHGDSPREATVHDQFSAIPLTLHAQIRREVKEKELKKYGFDEVRDIVVTIPHALLDEQGVTVRHGDEFIWDGDRYKVLQHESAGYWRNTNLRLYHVLNCEHARVGA